MRVSETRRGRGRCGRLLVLWTTLVRVVPRAAGSCGGSTTPLILSELTQLTQLMGNLKESLVL